MYDVISFVFPRYAKASFSMLRAFFLTVFAWRAERDDIPPGFDPQFLASGFPQ